MILEQYRVGPPSRFAGDSKPNAAHGQYAHHRRHWAALHDRRLDRRLCAIRTTRADRSAHIHFMLDGLLVNLGCGETLTISGYGLTSGPTPSVRSSLAIGTITSSHRTRSRSPIVRGRRSRCNAASRSGHPKRPYSRHVPAILLPRRRLIAVHHVSRLGCVDRRCCGDSVRGRLCAARRPNCFSTAVTHPRLRHPNYLTC